MILRGRRVLRGGQPSTTPGIGADRFIGTKPVPTAIDDEYDQRYHPLDVEMEPTPEGDGVSE